jgi:hypothetical protein
MTTARLAPPGGDVADGGVEGNARLTSTTGIILFILFAAIGITLLSIRRLVLPHVFIGFLLIPPVALKLGSTGYRFLRYYLGDTRYQVAGPPVIELRLLAPVVVVSTVVVFWSGVTLWVGGDSLGWLGRSWLSWHKLSFIFWIFATGIHVLAYIVKAGELGLADFIDGHRVRGALTRQGLLAAGLVLGIVLAIAMLSLRTPFLTPIER